MRRLTIDSGRGRRRLLISMTHRCRCAHLYLSRPVLAEESAHAWSKALYVTDRLKTIRPYKYDDIERYAAALFNCMIAMGHSLDEAVAVVNEINAWPEIERETGASNGS